MSVGLPIGSRPLRGPTWLRRINQVTGERIARLVLGYVLALILVVIGVAVAVAKWHSDPLSAFSLLILSVGAFIGSCYFLNKRTN